MADSFNTSDQKCRLFSGLMRYREAALAAEAIQTRRRASGP